MLVVNLKKHCTMQKNSIDAFVAGQAKAADNDDDFDAFFRDRTAAP